jgi:hypothetical protein
VEVRKVCFFDALVCEISKMIPQTSFSGHFPDKRFGKRSPILTNIRVIFQV